MSRRYIIKEYKPFLDDFTDKLVNEFVKSGLITLKDSETATSTVSEAETGQSTAPTSNLSFPQLFELRNLVYGVSQNLTHKRIIDGPPKFSTSLFRLIEMGAIYIHWTDKKFAAQTLDNLDDLSSEESNIASVEKIFADKKISISSLIYQLLEFYGVEKAIQYFEAPAGNILKPNRPGNADVDLLINANSGRFTPLLFEFKFRRQSTFIEKSILLKALNSLIKYNSHYGAYYFLIMFTNQNTSKFAGQLLKFQDAINSISEFEPYKNQISFLQIPINELNRLDKHFEQFINEYVHIRFTRTFKAQPAPKNNKERNDDFLENIYTIKDATFKIKITPDDTRFWRFGFRFIKDDIFPSIDEGRHSHDSVADIHLSVGDQNSDKQWNYERQLTLTHYHVSPIGPDFSSYLEYNGEPVILTVIVDKSNIVEFKVEILDKFMSMQTFDLSKFRLCKMFAWAEDYDFKLNTSIEVNYR